MAKLTMTIIETLYTYGKAVHNRELELSEATKKVIAMYPGDIAETSAKFYIGLYSEYLSGKGSTWNQNSALVLYYVENIAKELGNDVGLKAFQAGMKFAKAKTKNKLISDLKELWECISGDKAPDVFDINENAFEEWLRKGPENKYAENTVKHYIRALKKAEEWLSIKLSTHVMDTTSMDEFLIVESEIKNAANFESVNQDHGHGDLSAALHAYKEFLSDKTDEVEEDGEEEMHVSTKETFKKIKDYIESKGFSYKDKLIENFYLSLKSKPFVILAGTSGTGKTRLVKLFAEAIGATSDNGRYKLVPVRPDWSDSSDLFGHVNLQGNFVPGAITDFIKDAMDNINEPYFLCLDEMNLARVEYYLSDFLSLIETRKRNEDKGQILTDKIVLDDASREAYDGLYLPENLYVVGTVNMDETTFPFSKKVLDRANTIEFSYVDLKPEFDSVEEDAKAIYQDNGFLRTEYIILKTDIEASEHEFVSNVCAELQVINEILQEANAHVGYRVRDEIVFYMLNNKKTELIEYDEALDNEIMQKILPRIQGSGVATKELLCELFKKFAGDYSGLSPEQTWKKMKAYIDTNKCKYKKSAEKICYMMRRFEEDGFTSYWL